MNATVNLVVMLAMLALATWIMWQTIKPNVIAAQRWKMINRLRSRYHSLTIATDDDGQVMIECYAGHDGLMLRAIGASVDVALAQAINYMDRAS